MTTIYGYLRLNDHGLTKIETYRAALEANGVKGEHLVTEKILHYIRSNLGTLIHKLQSGDTVVVCRKSHLSANKEIAESLIGTINQHSAFLAIIDEKLVHQPGGTTKEWEPKGHLPQGKWVPRQDDGGGNG
jgi:DNA invertase Pin-like site-specific DNA recombinase